MIDEQCKPFVSALDGAFIFPLDDCHEAASLETNTEGSGKLNHFTQDVTYTDDFKGREGGAMSFTGDKDSFAEIRSPEKYFCMSYRYWNQHEMQKIPFFIACYLF